jgi:hypothetical protein
MMRLDRQAHLPSSPDLPYLVQLLSEGFEANLSVPGQGGQITLFQRLRN